MKLKVKKINQFTLSSRKTFVIYCLFLFMIAIPFLPLYVIVRMSRMKKLAKNLHSNDFDHTTVRFIVV